MDETYVKVGGRWKYLFRAVDKPGVLIGFMLSHRGSSSAAHRFLKKALIMMRCWPPFSITTDQLGSQQYGQANGEDGRLQQSETAMLEHLPTEGSL